MGLIYNLLGEEWRDEYKAMYTDMIDRKGAKELLAWMEENGFFKAPASTRYHLSAEGGLVLHSIHVARRLLAMEESYQYDRESIAICGLLHDLCKIDCYEPDDEKGWRYRKDALPLGHGEKSVMLIQRYMELTDEEMMAIRWHMGAFDEAFRGGSRDMDRAWERSELAVMLHIADMQATHLDE